MSLSDEWTEWHLTPRGWESGTERIDFAGITPKNRPEDAVLTVRWRESLSSMYSKPDRYHTTVWRSNNKEAVDKLLSQFGDPPKSL